MYFLSPIVGWLVDRFGSRPVIAAGGVILFIGSEMASHTRAEDSLGVFVGLFLVGVGWSSASSPAARCSPHRSPWPSGFPSRVPPTSS
ncbi:MAG: hypothetical protein R2710_05375 [Acidimicrobiales bacterium]